MASLYLAVMAGCCHCDRLVSDAFGGQVCFEGGWFRCTLKAAGELSSVVGLDAGDLERKALPELFDEVGRVPARATQRPSQSSSGELVVDGSISPSGAFIYRGVPVEILASKTAHQALPGHVLHPDPSMYRLSCHFEVPSCLAHIACPFGVQNYPSTKVCHLS